MIDARELAGVSLQIEHKLARAQALARVLTFALRNQQPEPMERCSKDLASVLDESGALLLRIAREFKEAKQ